MLLDILTLLLCAMLGTWCGVGLARELAHPRKPQGVKVRTRGR